MSVSSYLVQTGPISSFPAPWASLAWSSSGSSQSYSVTFAVRPQFSLVVSVIESVSIQSPKNSKSCWVKSNQTDATFVSLAASSWISLKVAFIASTFFFVQTDVILKRRFTNGRLLQFPNKFQKIQAHERDFMSSVCYRWSNAEYDTWMNEYLNFVAKFRYAYIRMCCAIIFVGDFCSPRPLQLKYISQAPPVRDHNIGNSMAYVTLFT